MGKRYSQVQGRAQADRVAHALQPQHDDGRQKSLHPYIHSEFRPENISDDGLTECADNSQMRQFIGAHQGRK